MSKARIGIVSATGSGRKRTIPALQDSSSCVVSAIHGRDEARVAEIAAQYSIDHTYTDLADFVSAHQFDVAIVCSPPFLHVEQLSLLLAARIPCLVEKPITLNIADASELQQLAKANSAPVRIAHQLRHQNTFKAIKDVVNNGDLGSPMFASFEWSFALNRAAASSKWKMLAAKNGKSCLYDAGVHCVDAAIGLFGPGHVVGVNAHKIPGDDVYESVDMLSQHGDVACSIRASRLYGPYSNDLKISGINGQITADNFFTEKSSASIELRIGGSSSRIQRLDENPYRLEVEDFVRVVHGEPATYSDTSMDDAIAALRMLEQADALAV